MLLSPLDLDSPIQRTTKSIKNGSRNSQTMSPKSVSFLIETPLQVNNKSKKGTFAESLGENMKKYKLNLFASRSRCKMMFQALDNRGRPKLNSNLPKKPSEKPENQLNITDSFQYRFESLLEEGDYVLDVTQQKKPRQTPAAVGLMIPLHRKKHTETKLEKTKLKTRRKSDISLWSGGVSELENKTVFWTFEYISKPVHIIDTNISFKNRGSERMTPYHKSAGLGIPDGTPTRVSALGRLDGTPTRLSGIKRHESTPMSVGKKPLNSSMKVWSAKILDLKKESSDDKNSPFFIPVKASVAKVNSINQSDVDSSDDDGSDIKLDKVTNPSVVSSPFINGDPKSPANFNSALNKIQTTFSTAMAGSNDNIGFKPSSDNILSTHLIKSESEQQLLHKPLVILPSKSQERFKPFKSGPSPLPVFIRDFSGAVKPQRPSPKITPGSVMIPRHRKNFSVGSATVDNSAASLKMSMTQHDSILINSNENSPTREESNNRDPKKVKDFKRILEQHKSNRTQVLLKLQKKLVAKVYSPENSVIIPNNSTKMTSESAVFKKSKMAKPTLKDKKNFFMDHLSPNETVTLPKVPTSRTHSVSWSFIKPPLTTSNSKRSLETASKLKISGSHHRQSVSVSINVDSAKIIKQDKPVKEKEKSKMVKAPTKFKPKISQPKQLKNSYAPMNHQL